MLPSERSLKDASGDRYSHRISSYLALLAIIDLRLWEGSGDRIVLGQLQFFSLVSKENGSLRFFNLPLLFVIPSPISDCVKFPALR